MTLLSSNQTSQVLNVAVFAGLVVTATLYAVAEQLWHKSDFNVCLGQDC